MSGCFCTGACRETGMCPNQRSGPYMNRCAQCGQYWFSVHVCPNVPRSTTAPYTPVHERGYPDTAQSEIARLIDLVLKLSHEIELLRREVAALQGRPQ